MRVATADYVTPIYGTDRDFGRVFGTASFVKLRGAQYLLTAAHVLKDARKKYPHLAYSIGDGTVPELIRGPIQCLDFPTDIALTRVSPTLGAKRTVDAMAFSGSTENLATDLLVLQGFPTDRPWSDWTALGNGIRSRPLAYGTAVAATLPHWCDPLLHIAIDHRVEEQIDVDGDVVPVPTPHGLSGSLLWRTNRNTHRSGWTQAAATVVGVITDWAPDYNCLVATRLGVVRQGLFQFLRQEAAYFRWQDRGAPQGDDWNDWFWAEQNIRTLG